MGNLQFLHLVATCAMWQASFGKITARHLGGGGEERASGEHPKMLHAPGHSSGVTTQKSMCSCARRWCCFVNVCHLYLN